MLPTTSEELKKIIFREMNFLPYFARTFLRIRHQFLHLTGIYIRKIFGFSNIFVSKRAKVYSRENFHTGNLVEKSTDY